MAAFPSGFLHVTELVQGNPMIVEKSAETTERELAVWNRNRRE
jgi:hypothetical protein